MTTLRSYKTTVFLAVTIFMVMLNSVQGAPQPQNRPPGLQGITGAFGQLFNGAVDATNSAGSAVANGASTGFQAFGNTFQDLFNGLIGGYNSAASGLVDGFQSFVGSSNSTTIITTTPRR